jgi:hypothetical protein
LELIGQARTLTASGVTAKRKKCVLEAQDLIPPLEDANFFSVYVDFGGIRDKISDELNHLYHNTRKHMDHSLTAYFTQRFQGHDVKVLDKPKEMSGVQVNNLKTSNPQCTEFQFGLFVCVTDSSTKATDTYYAKTMGDIPSVNSVSLSKTTIDLTEPFFYNVLRLIAIGPSEVYIVPDSSKSECAYLVTKISKGQFSLWIVIFTEFS